MVAGRPRRDLAAWPRDDHGRPIRSGNNDSPSRRTVGPEQLRRLAATVDSAPAQGLAEVRYVAARAGAWIARNRTWGASTRACRGRAR